jgi:hypothetical protein
VRRTRDHGIIPSMHNAISRDELRRMKELAVKGRLTEERMIDTADLSAEDEAEIVHLTDVVEMQGRSPT